MSDYSKQMQDAVKQTEALTSTWVDAQKRMLSGYVEMMSTFTGTKASSTLQGERTKALGIMEDSFKRGLDFQREMTRLYMQNFSEKMGFPKPVAEGAKQFQEMVSSLIESQKALSGMFFEMARQVGDTGMMDTWQKESQKLVETWRQAAEKVMQAQAEVARASAKAGEKTAKAAQ